MHTSRPPGEDIVKSYAHAKRRYKATIVSPFWFMPTHNAPSSLDHVQDHTCKFRRRCASARFRLPIRATGGERRDSVRRSRRIAPPLLESIDGRFCVFEDQFDFLVFPPNVVAALARPIGEAEQTVGDFPFLDRLGSDRRDERRSRRSCRSRFGGFLHWLVCETLLDVTGGAEPPPRALPLSFCDHTAPRN